MKQFLLTKPLGRGQWGPATLELYTPTIAGVDTGEGIAVEDKIPGKMYAGTDRKQDLDRTDARLTLLLLTLLLVCLEKMCLNRS